MKRGFDHSNGMHHKEPNKKIKQSEGPQIGSSRFGNGPVPANQGYFPMVGNDPNFMYNYPTAAYLTEPYPSTMIPAVMGGMPAPAMFSAAGFTAAAFHSQGMLSARVPSMNGNLNMNNRTAYVGNIPADATIEDLLNKVHTGSIEHCRLLPEKSCAFVTFTDPYAAQQFVRDCKMQKLVLHNQECRVNFGKMSTTPPAVARAIGNGATRSVYIGDIDDSITDEMLRKLFSEFGQIDTVKLIPAKKIAFVYMTAIASANKAVQSLGSDPKWQKYKINFGKDRCNPFHTHAKAIVAGNGEFTNQALNRTIYLGLLSTSITAKELCDHITGGVLEKIKIIPEKGIAFITFVDTDAAHTFHQKSTDSEGLLINGKKVKVGWGKPQIRSPDVSQALQNGGTRSLYIKFSDRQFDADEIQKHFGPFGELELINLFPDKHAAVISFTDILSASKAFESLKTHAQFENVSIGYAKDRCSLSESVAADSIEYGTLIP